MNALHIQDHASDAVSGWAGWALAHPEFGSSVNPIPTRRGQVITTCPPGFENLIESLHMIRDSF